MEPNDSGCHIVLQAQQQRVKRQLATRGVAQVFVHGEPGFQTQRLDEAVEAALEGMGCLALQKTPTLKSVTMRVVL